MFMIINGNEVKAAPGQTIMEAARAAGIVIPGLCHHPGLEPYGGCRLCMVEITKPGWKGEGSLVTSCNYEAEDGLVVDTRSKKTLASRREVLALLLARVPDSEVIRDLAAKFGVKETPYKKREDADLCIMCTICTRSCEAVGAFAITTQGRGGDKEVAPPLADTSACVGCLACARNCPTGAIPFEDGPLAMTVWDRTFEKMRCTVCGKPTIPRAMAEHFAKKAGLPVEYFQVCDACHKRQTAEAFAKVLY